MIRTFSELSNLKTFEERYEYLKLGNIVGDSTFGFDRYINQILYKSSRWKKTRDSVIIRDNGCDLGIDGREIYDKILVHHMNPISVEDVTLERDYIFDPEFLISTSTNTHNAIHYGNQQTLIKMPIERRKNDTCPWKEN